ncbi:DUF2075 domain-containing protein [Shewanella loihica]|uniref:Schlafen group 3-like DNA/RNA helicase domain-containing protein n=1 Tax=Shewanella loihica (strain ATCC BAA-1088 / PV-4) TaxID=323850 RepID=A3QIQ9_SHELP|nr:DUF2075 domain-containing protein [Shewanella loihica]ABO25357.1 conserved hypothetical protein [Shewanella loihica PV-4]
MTRRAFYSAPLNEFLLENPQAILGKISQLHTQDIKHHQTSAWTVQIAAIQTALVNIPSDKGWVFFEFLIPRMGRRADVVLIYSGIIFVLEFKIGASNYLSQDLRQTHGYALDLKNFHRGSHGKCIVPILVATATENSFSDICFAADYVASPICINIAQLHQTITQISIQHKQPDFRGDEWAKTGYMPTPTIVEAAQALYASHNVEDIARNEADNQNLGKTCNELIKLIHQSRTQKSKAICFVTGVPGAGKTLIGVNLANAHSIPEEDEYSVFLSGNGPLVTVLQEALANDASKRTNSTKARERQKTSQFIQNIHRFRDEALDGSIPPEKVVIFDEAQRAWNLEQTSKFMQTKRGYLNFNQSEPEFLISVMDRHQDWAVIIALIGGGQEINTGEAGLRGWLDALENRFANWNVYCSPNILTSNYISTDVSPDHLENVNILPNLHLATSMRSFRAEKLSDFVHHVIAGDGKKAKELSDQLQQVYPLKITRDLNKAKKWLRTQTRANESKGLLASSNAIRLKAEGIHVKNRFDPAAWYLNPQEDIRSCHFLEDCATEFDIQGLELDWCLVGWDADYRHNGDKFEHWKFKGTKWQNRNKDEDKRYLENAYRVLLTRARQGMVIFIPEGTDIDSTRKKSLYLHTYQYLLDCGFKMI